MNRRNIFAVAATVLGLSVIPVVAQKTHDGAADGSRHARFLDHVASVLNLTDAQKAAAQQIFADTKTQAEPLMQQMKQNRTDMQAAVKTNNTGQISVLASRQGQLAGQLSELHAKAMASFYAQLTPEQKAKADQMHERFQGGMQRHFGAMRRHHEGPPSQTQQQ